MDDTRTSKVIVNTDLQYICYQLQDELASMAGSSLLITGGAGFLGYYLAQTVLHWNRQSADHRKIQLTIYDNLSRGVPQWLTHLNQDHDIILARYDITQSLPQDIVDFEFIIHAASIASPTYYRAHPIETMDANVNGLRNLLGYCLDQQSSNKPIKGLLFFSSSEIYGDPPNDYIPTPEHYWGNVSCTGPRACYDESKRYGETLCVNFARHYELPIKIARPFNNYGPGLRITDRRVLSDFARDVLSGRDIVMLSSGTATRTFCYVADAVVGYYKVLVSGQSGQAYNIGVDEPEISIEELAHKVGKLARKQFSWQGKIVHRTSPDRDYLTDNPSRRCPDITKARTELGYSPTIPLEEGLRRSMIWYGDNRDAEEDAT